MRRLKMQTVLKWGHHTKCNLLKKIVNYIILHYYHADINCESEIDEDVIFAHNGFGTVIHKDAVIKKGTQIQHHVSIVNNWGGVPSIGQNVFVGCHAILMGNIQIGDNASIGAGSVVMHDVPPNAVAVGNPAKVVRYKK